MAKIHCGVKPRGFATSKEDALIFHLPLQKANPSSIIGQGKILRLVRNLIIHRASTYFGCHALLNGSVQDLIPVTFRVQRQKYSAGHRLTELS